MPGITRCTTLKILGVTIINGLSMAEHIHGVLSYSQTLHALRVLRAHGMPASALHEVFQAVVIAKLYAMHPVLGGVSPRLGTTSE